MQKDRLIDLMEEKFQFINGRHCIARGDTRKNLIWQDIATELNLIGPSKSVEKWIKCFSDMKNLVKIKLSKHRLYMVQTGGGPASDIVFNSYDDKIIRLCGINVLDDQQNVGRMGRPIPMYPFVQPSPDPQ